MEATVGNPLRSSGNLFRKPMEIHMESFRVAMQDHGKPIKPFRKCMKTLGQSVRHVGHASNP